MINNLINSFFVFSSFRYVIHIHNSGIIKNKIKKGPLKAEKSINFSAFPLIITRSYSIFDKIVDQNKFQLNCGENNIYFGYTFLLKYWANTYNEYFLTKSEFFIGLELKEFINSLGFDLVGNEYYDYNYPNYIYLSYLKNFPVFSYYEKDEFGDIDYNKEKYQLLGGLDMLTIYCQLMRERPEFINIFIYYFFVGSGEPKTLNMNIFFSELQQIYNFLILTIKIKYMLLVNYPEKYLLHLEFNQLITKLSTFLVNENFIHDKNELTFQQGTILYLVWIISNFYVSIEELFTNISEFITSFENILKKVLPQFLFSTFLKYIYKSIPFVIVLFLKINLGIAWAGIFLIGYLIFRIINIIGLFLLYVWRAIKIKRFSKSSFDNKVIRLLNILYIPVKVAKGVFLLIILWCLFKNHMEIFFLMPILYQIINYINLKLSIIIKNFYWDSWIGWLNYNLDPHSSGGWEPFKERILFAYRNEADGLKYTIQYEKKLIKHFSFLPVKIGKILLGEKFTK